MRGLSLFGLSAAQIRISFTSWVYSRCWNLSEPKFLAVTSMLIDRVLAISGGLYALVTNMENRVIEFYQSMLAIYGQLKHGM